MCLTSNRVLCMSLHKALAARVSVGFFGYRLFCRAACHRPAGVVVQAHPPASCFQVGMTCCQALAGPYRFIAYRSARTWYFQLTCFCPQAILKGALLKGASCKGPGQTCKVAGLQLVAWARRRETSCVGREQAAFSWPLQNPSVCASSIQLATANQQLPGGRYTHPCLLSVGG